jgi:hypothetical protein
MLCNAFRFVPCVRHWATSAHKTGFIWFTTHAAYPFPFHFVLLGELPPGLGWLAFWLSQRQHLKIWSQLFSPKFCFDWPVAKGLGPCSTVGIALVCKVLLCKVTYFGSTTVEQFMWWYMLGCAGKGRVCIQFVNHSVLDSCFVVWFSLTRMYWNIYAGHFILYSVSCSFVYGNSHSLGFHTVRERGSAILLKAQGNITFLFALILF